jgi:hypothetical protein
VVRRVVLNQIDPVAASVEGGHHHLLQNGKISLLLKIMLLMKVSETGVVQTNGSENLLRMALPSRGDLRLTPAFMRTYYSEGKSHVWKAWRSDRFDRGKPSSQRLPA